MRIPTSAMARTRPPAQPVLLDDVLTEAERRWHAPLAKEEGRLQRQPGVERPPIPAFTQGVDLIGN
jgi:hypothetical protein